MATTKQSTPPPIIGKSGRYTVFLTPPITPKPSETTTTTTTTPSTPHPPKNVVVLPPPVLPPPKQFDNNKGLPESDSSAFGFFWDAVAKVQNAHSSLDEYVAGWFGLNRSKYQWALDNYFETKAVGHEDVKAKELAAKGQSV